MRVELLLGFTKEGEVVFGNIDTDRGYFSASFDTSYPFELTEESALEAIESYIDSSDKEWVLNKLEEYDCKPSELAQRIYEGSYDVIGDFFDNSLYPETFQIEGIENNIYFLASSCGQHDTRGEMETYINKDLYDTIHDMWDKYHLKGNAPADEVDRLIEAIEHQNNTIDEYKVVENWLKRNFD